MIKQAKRSMHSMTVLVITATFLLFSCGSGTIQTSPTSTTITGLSKVSMSPSLSTSQPAQCSEVATVAAGAYHTVGLKTDGTVMAVGYNGYGQLNVSSWTGIKAIAAGAYHTVGLKSDGTVVAVGSNSYGQLNVSSWTGITAIAAGAYHTIGLKSDGTVVAVGNNGSGQSNVSSWTGIKAIAAGAYHTIGLKSDGTVVAAGYNNYGQSNVSSWTTISAIAAGAYHTVGLKEDGTVVAIGYNNYGQLNVSSWTAVKSIAAGWYHTIALHQDGTVAAVGNNNYGQLNTSAWTNIKAVAGGYAHTVGLNQDGTLVAVGSNGYGQSNVSTWTNLMPVCDASCAPDVTPPITTALMTGVLGNNGWYVSDVVMTLTAMDNEGGSGVKEIHYTVDGVETVVPGSSASHTISGDGTHTASWYAIDNAGNVETPPQQVGINIDTTAPVISGLGTNKAVLWPPNHKMVNIVIGGTVSDNASSIASAVFTVTDEYGIYNKTVSGLGSVITLEAWRDGDDYDGRVYTITAVVTDNAGNQSTGSTTVLVPHDMQ